MPVYYIAPFGSSPPRTTPPLELTAGTRDSKSEDEEEDIVKVKPRVEETRVHPQTVRSLVKHYNPNRLLLT